MDEERIRAYGQAVRIEAERERLARLRTPLAVWTRLMQSVQAIEAHAREQGHLEFADQLAAAVDASMQFWLCADAARFDNDS